MLAVIVALPDPTKVASPLLFIVATLLELLVHCTRFVNSRVEPSSKVPVALNCCVPCVWNSVGLEGSIEMDWSFVAVTVKVAVPETELWDAEIVVVPFVTAVATPAALTVATLGEDELQVADEVISLV
jgi:hypothetical protein